MNIACLSDENITRFGDYDAVVDGTGVWRSTRLHRHELSVAGALVEIGVSPGDRVLILLPNCAELVVIFTAVLRCGAVAVPVFAGSSPSEIERVVHHCTPRAAVLPAALAESMQRAVALVPLKVGCRECDPAPAGYIPFTSLLDRTPLKEPVPRAAQDTAQLCYTSGASGTPKAVVYTHGSVRARVSPVSAQHEDAVIPVALPLNSVGAGLLTGRLTKKWTLVLADRFDPVAFLETIPRVRATTLLLVPSACEALLAIPSIGNVDVSSVRDLDVTGAPVSPTLLERLEQVFHIPPRVRYGMTEAGGGIAATTPASSPGSVGRALPGVALRVVGEDGLDVRAGEIGELHVKTPWVAAGYYVAPAETAAAFQHGWLRTGDLGRVDEHAELFLAGRRSDMIIQGGVNIYPQQIADVIRARADVAACAVVGIPHEVLGDQSVACVVLREGKQTTEDEILSFCRSRIDPRQAPVRVLFRAALPMTFNGKIHTHLLREELLAAETAVPHETETSRRLRAMRAGKRAGALRDAITTQLRSLLSLAEHTPIDPAMSFGEIGVTSIGSVQLSLRLGKLLGRPIGASDAFAYPNVNAFARHLDVLLFAQPSPPAPTPRSSDSSEATPVAIVGMACRLPGNVETPEAFWDVLRQARCLVTTWPRHRGTEDRATGGPATGGAQGAFLERLDLFDASFFHLAAQAASIDPQHRLLLEVTWEAFERAGCDPLALDGDRVAAFVGISGAHYHSADGLGVAPSMAVGRVCHFLNLRGPALTVDTSCSSSLVALHCAVQSLQRGECQMALVAGVKASGYVTASSAVTSGVLAPDGRSKAFDASADGYGRGEGCVAMVLQRVSDARANGRHIHAVVRGSAINHDGRSSSLTAPNPLAQEAVIRRALMSAGVEPDDIHYVETHGTGTLLGDPIEVQALAQTFSSRQRPLTIGSVKTNVGHLEAGAGLAGVLKVVLSMRHRTIPASLHLQRPNPHIPWRGIPVGVQTTAGPWADDGARLLAGVSSFGMSGTNAHVVLEGPSDSDVADRTLVQNTRPWLLPLSARTPVALQRLVERYVAFLDGHAASESTLDAVSYTAACCRTHFEHRVAVVGRDRSEWASALRARGNLSRVSRRRTQDPAGVVMAFSGQGAQWAEMGRQLIAAEPAFRRAIEDCAARVDRHTSWHLVDELCCDDAHSRLSETEIAQPVIFALQVALVALWREWGIEPAAVVGHSVGEIAAAHTAGALSLDAAAQLAVIRGRLLHQSAGSGQMALIHLSKDDTESLIAGLDDVEIAAVSAPRMTTVTGTPAAVAAAISIATSRGVRCQKLRGTYAFHSAQMERYGRALVEAIATIDCGDPAIPMMSSLTGDQAASLDVTYWAAQLRRPVVFQQAIERLIDLGYECFLEVGPHPVLVPAIAQTLDTRGKEGTLACSLRRGRPELESMLDALAHLYEGGVSVQWQRSVPRPLRLADVPTYPFQRQSYWFPQTDDRVARRAPLVERVVQLPHAPGSYLAEFTLALSDPTLSYFADHRVRGEIWFPAAGFLECAHQAARLAFDNRVPVLQDVRFHRELAIEETERRLVHLLIEGAGDRPRFRIFSRARPDDDPAIEHVEGWIQLRDQHEARADAPVPPDPLALWRGLPSKEPAYASAPVEFGPRFRALLEVASGDGQALGRLRPVHEIVTGGEAHGVHPVLLDAAIHVLAAMSGPEKRPGEIRVPVAVGEFSVRMPGSEAVWAYARRPAEGPAIVSLLDARSQCVAEIAGVSLSSLGQRSTPASDAAGLNEIAWRPLARGTPERATGTWIVLTDRDGIGRTIESRLERDGVRVLSIDRRSGDERIREVLDTAPPRERLTIVHLWSLEAPDTLDTSAHTPDALAMATAIDVIRFARILARLDRQGPTRVFLVTRGAQALQSSVTSIAQAPVWGAGATLSRECPAIEMMLVDIDPAAEDAGELLEELLATDGERRVALRGSERLVPRLVRRDVTRDGALRLPADRTFVITGGHGGVGLVIAKRLVARGVRHVGLIGRTAPSVEAAAALAALTALGANVRFAAADVADASQLALAMQQLSDERAPIGGIVHCAGVVDDSLLANLSDERAMAVLAPKICGAWNLHRWALDQNLEYMVFCASTAGVLGSPGQAHYAAGNAFLDALAHARHARGLPAQSIDWGGWLNTGMTARLAAEGRGHRSTSRLLTQDEGAALFERVLADKTAVQVTAMKVHHATERDDRDPLLDELRSNEVEARVGFAARLAQALPGQRGHALRDHVRTIVAAVLDRPADEIHDDASFDDLGLDSLTSLILRQRFHEELGVVVGTATLHDKNTVRILAAQLEERVAPAAAAAATHSPVVPLQTDGLEPALWLVHPIGGMVTCYTALVHEMGQRIFAFEAPGLHDDSHAVASIEELAEIYIDAMRQHQPDGPYLLGGWSLGGCVAYEMARRLRARHSEVALVALIDTHHPRLSTTPEGRGLVHQALMGTLDETSLSEGDDSTTAAIRQFLWDRAAQIDTPRIVPTGALGELSDANAARLFALYEAHLRAHRRYVPQSYEGHVLLIRCNGAPTGDPDFGWRDIVGRLEVQLVDGDHYSVMRMPHVVRLAATLRNAIQSAVSATI